MRLVKEPVGGGNRRDVVGRGREVQGAETHTYVLVQHRRDQSPWQIKHMRTGNRDRSSIMTVCLGCGGRGGEPYISRNTYTHETKYI